ncbi:hypothetical protein E4H12_06220 [Candidatus Thorarchaeota archaeon]|nr:MAG: hypothetical protein E4H12_06220 [Candidatus Thorarchaeota archaeon]
MRRRKRTKSIDDVSVSKLLDDFVDLEADDDSKRAKEIDDQAYIDMMLKKDAQRKLERMKRNPNPRTHDDVESSPVVEIEEKTIHLSVPELEMYEAHCESDLSREDEAVIEEIMKTQSPKEEPALTGRMKVAVEFLENDVTTSEAKHEARKTLEKHRKDPPVSKKKEIPVISEKRAPVKACQNCYFCVKEKKVGGSCWCHCTNPGRSTHAIVKGSWVKSRLNLPCWKQQQE